MEGRRSKDGQKEREGGHKRLKGREEKEGNRGEKTLKGKTQEMIEKKTRNERRETKGK